MSFVGPRQLMPAEIEVEQNVSGKAVMLEQVKATSKDIRLLPDLPALLKFLHQEI